MSRPEDIPQDVWEAAEKALMQANIKAHMLAEPTDPLECISRAIIAAKEEEREACAQLAWDIAEGRMRQKGEAVAVGKKREARDFETMAISANDVRFHILKRGEE